MQLATTGLKIDGGDVWLWLTNRAAGEQRGRPTPQRPDGLYPPASEHLGQVDRWHVYLYADAIALKAWPTIRDDLKRVPGQRTEIARASSSDA